MTITKGAVPPPSRTARGVLTGVGHLGRSAPSALSSYGTVARWAWAYWLACAGFALTLAVTTGLGPHRVWGSCAAAGYATAAVLTLGGDRSWRRAGAVAALVGAVVVPLVVLVVSGAAQSEVGVVERSGDLLLHSGSPYLPDPVRTVDFNPYLPGMALFGLPRALFGAGPLTDARVWFCAAFLACMVFAARRPAGASRPRPSSVGPATAVASLAAFPAVALPLAVGGVDLPVVGLMCLGLALAGRRGSGTAAGLAMGAAAALKWTAWPLLPVGLVLLAVTTGRMDDSAGRRRRTVGGGRRPCCRSPSPTGTRSSNMWCSSRSGRAGCVHRRPVHCRDTCWPPMCPAARSSPRSRSWPPRSVWLSRS